MYKLKSRSWAQWNLYMNIMIWILYCLLLQRKIYMWKRILESLSGRNLFDESSIMTRLNSPGRWLVKFRVCLVIGWMKASFQECRNTLSKLSTSLAP